jgi:dUTP pyrophosphatase
MNNSMEIQVYLSLPEARLPTRAIEGSVGYDLYSAVSGFIEPRSRKLFDTGVQMDAPDGIMMPQILPRSGLASKGIDVAAGVIDPSYRGNLKVLLVNNSDVKYEVAVGDRIAQLVFVAVYMPILKSTTDTLPLTQRQTGGFGSTGK